MPHRPIRNTHEPRAQDLAPQRSHAPHPQEPALQPHAAAGDQGRLLATAVSWNAAFSAANGLVLLVGAVGLAGPIGAATWLLVAVGGGLVVMAGLLVWLLAVPQRLLAGTRLVVAADVAWVVGSFVLLAGFPSALAPAGRLALAVVSMVIAGLAAAQVVGLRRARPGPITAAAPIALRVERTFDVPVDVVWDAVADAADYARFVSGIASTEVVEGEGEGMIRVCTDDRGGQWAERCTVWQPRSRYRMRVDVDSYPVYYRMLLHEFAQTWTVEPVAGGTRVVLAFDGAVKLGVVGRFAARMLGNRRRLDAILDAHERELRATASG